MGEVDCFYYIGMLPISEPSAASYILSIDVN